MKLRLASDLHLEMVSDPTYIDGLIPVLPGDKETTLLLLGDIHVGVGATLFVREMVERFKYVIYILGNHEYYNHKFYELREQLRGALDISNVFILENQSIVLDGQKFAGCTLWTNGDKEHPLNKIRIQKGLADYRCIEGSHGNKLTVDETIATHKASLDFLRKEVDNDTIVLTHHVPLLDVLSDPIHYNSPIQGGFESDLKDLIMDLQPKYWLYGHNHYSCCPIPINNTTLFSNQACYVHESMNGYTPEFVFDNNNFWAQERKI